MKFRLQRILDLRMKEEESLKLELANIRKKIRDMTELIEKLDDEMNNITLDMLSEGSKSGNEIAYDIDLLNNSSGRKEFLEKQLVELKKNEDALIEQFMKKRSERRSLEKLRERKIEEYNVEAERKDRKDMDEIAERRYWW